MMRSDALGLIYIEKTTTLRFIGPGKGVRKFERTTQYGGRTRLEKRMKDGMKKGFSSYYDVISVGNLPTTFSTDFFLPLLNLSYISSRARVGIKPEATHRLDSSISMTLVVRIY